MANDTLLTHLAARLGHGTEDLATETLEFILRTRAAADGLVGHATGWGRDLPPIARFGTQFVLTEEDAIPDLVGITDDGSIPLIIEAKFGAALTPNQPVTYLRFLLDREEPSLLLFLVPQRRLGPIWAELRRRCEADGLPLSASEGSLRSATVDHVTVGVTSWGELLTDIDNSLRPRSDHQQTIAEINQLRGLCDRADQTAFQPFTTDFLGGATGRHLLDLDGLLNEAVANLVERGMAGTERLRWSSGQGWFGRYFWLGAWECLLHVNFDRWGTQRGTPLWLRVADPRANGNSDFLEAMTPLLAASPPRLLKDDGRLQIPLHLPHDQDRDEVYRVLESQLIEIHDLMARCAPVDSVADAASTCS